MSERIDAFEKNEDKKVSLYADITLKQRKRFGTMIREEARALRIRIPNSGETE
jgi:hypothetical protein